MLTHVEPQTIQRSTINGINRRSRHLECRRIALPPHPCLRQSSQAPEASRSSEGSERTSRKDRDVQSSFLRSFLQGPRIKVEFFSCWVDQLPTKATTNWWVSSMGSPHRKAIGIGNIMINQSILEGAIHRLAISCHHSKLSPKQQSHEVFVPPIDDGMAVLGWLLYAPIKFHLTWRPLLQKRLKGLKWLDDHQSI